MCGRFDFIFWKVHFQKIGIFNLTKLLELYKKEKLPFNRKRVPVEPGSGRSGHPSRPVGVIGGRQDEDAL